MNPGVLFVVALMGLAVCAIVVVIGVTWKPDNRTDKPKAPPKVKANGSVPAAALVATPLVSDQGAREVLRVLRDSETEELRVEVAGQRYARLDEIQAPEARTGLLTTLRDLEAFAAGASTAPSVVPTPAGTGPLTAALAAKQAPSGPAPLLAPSMNPFKQMLVLRDLSKTQLPPLKSIAEQIDDILQEKLAATAHGKRGIHVHSSPKGAALFSADGQDYDAVDSVPDDEVRTLIRASVAEWEQKP